MSEENIEVVRKAIAYEYHGVGDRAEAEAILRCAGKSGRRQSSSTKESRWLPPVHSQEVSPATCAGFLERHSEPGYGRSSPGLTMTPSLRTALARRKASTTPLAPDE